MRIVTNEAPRGSFEINWDSPQATDLQVWWPFLQQGEGRTIKEMVRGQALDATFDVSMDTDSWVSTVYGGRAVAFDGSGLDVARVTDDDALSMAQSNATILLFFARTSTAVSVGWAGKFGGTAPTREWGLWTTGSTNNVEFFRYDATGFFGAGPITNTAFFDGTPTLLVGRTNADGSIQTLAWKASTGLLVGGTNSATWNTNTATGVVFGSYNSTGGNQIISDIWDIRKYTRALSNNEILEIAHDPWDLYGEPRKSFGFVAAAGGAIPRSVALYHQRHHNRAA